MTKETSAPPRPAPRNTPVSGGLGFPRQNRILRPAVFRKVYDNGIRFSNPFFAAFCLARPISEHADSETGPRLGLTTPRALGKAVVRNRLRRRLREAFRLHRSELAPQWDLVLNPRRAALAATFAELENALGKVIGQCNSRS